MDSKNFQRYGSMARYGLPKVRKCMNCQAETADDGSSMWLRGFCCETCRLTYIEKLRRK